MRNFLRYLKVFLILTKDTFLVNAYRKLGFFIFFIGKILRFALYILFIFYVLQGGRTLAGYTTDQVVFFFLTFNLIDSLAQFLFRNVYTFRPLIISGNFDLLLSKPVNVLFRVLLGGLDLIDAATLPLFIGVVVWWGSKFHPTAGRVILYMIMVVNSLILSAGFHILVMGLAIITFEIDHLIMIYRDIESIGRFPVDIFREPVRTVLTFVIPLGVMLTVPAKVFFGIAPFWLVAVSFGIALVLFFLSLRFWNYALKRYTSASS